MEIIEDYPNNLIEFNDRFDSEEACREYLERLRWPDGFVCPRCQGIQAWPSGRAGLKECSICHYQTTVTAGTLFEGTRKPLKLWLLAMWLMTSEKNGISAKGLQRELGFTRYETVWIWLHKLRRVMVRPNRDRLTGHVEMDEIYLGGEGEGVRGRGANNKAIVVIAAEEDGKGIGRIRLGRVQDVSAKQLISFIENVVESGSVIHTDGWPGYQPLSSKPYIHRVSNVSRSEQLAPELLPRVHRVASLLKRWWLGTHQGAIEESHLDYYLDEFTFRFNRRKSKSRGKLFFRLVQQAVQIDPIRWEDVAAGRNYQKIG